MTKLLKETQNEALMQILTTILTTDTHPELKALIERHDLIEALQKDIKLEVLRQDVEHTIMLYNLPNIDIKKDTEIIQKAIDHIKENYNYDNYHEFIANFLREEIRKKTRLRFI